MNQIPNDVEAYRKGFNRGFTLCSSMKKLSGEFSSILWSVVSKEYHHSYGQGLKDGYQEGFRNLKKELVDKKLQELEAAHTAEQKAFQEQERQQLAGQSKAHNQKVQQRKAQVEQMRTTEPERGNEQER